MSLQYFFFQPVPVMSEYIRSPVGLHRPAVFSSCSSVWGPSSSAWGLILALESHTLPAVAQCATENHKKSEVETILQRLGRLTQKVLLLKGKQRTSRLFLLTLMKSSYEAESAWLVLLYYSSGPKPRRIPSVYAFPSGVTALRNIFKDRHVTTTHLP